MIHICNRSVLETKPTLLKSMHEDRKRVFVDIFGWNLESKGSEEIDEFDDNFATYLIGEDVQGTHFVSVRLLHTEKRHILGSLFPSLCDDAVPTGPAIREITRYIASPRARASERLVGRNMMARALIEYAYLNGIVGYTAVCEMSFLSQLIAAGWRCDPLVLPREVDGSIIGAFIIHVEPDTIEKMTRTWRYSQPALTAPPPLLRSAA